MSLGSKYKLVADGVELREFPPSGKIRRTKVRHDRSQERAKTKTARRSRKRNRS
jgi:hypothetical protein